MKPDAAEIAARLGEKAETVCRHYLPAGRREGNYWIVGDIDNTPGKSMYVRLHRQGSARPGKWTDAATGEHGDLLDIIRARCGLAAFPDTLNEAREFLALPNPDPPRSHREPAKTSRGSPEAIRRLHQASQPFPGTLAETYLRSRNITRLSGLAALRFHPRCIHRSAGRAGSETWPAMIAAVTDLSGAVTGLHRTWLARDGGGKAPLASPRRAMGRLLGNGVRFGAPVEMLAAGEGVETVLSVRQALPHLPMLAALSAGHLGAIRFPQTLKRLYILRDRDPAGGMAAQRLSERAQEVGVQPVLVSPREGDFNDDLQRVGEDALRTHLKPQLFAQDRSP